ncbi:ergothioneine biosynthesis protein EgtB [Methylicorpusculum sp.]|uniref:ergothioneine biosynthesis protein EgtB n=1 Tax=Methylicorpusculum sp. TaxID=2713644 RepID=UPI00271E03B0|nr:ergothioneine biosynthesis protein EgtB [Methylicorpusculum sp.]MDO8843724.1 ergothioneine biosynthesis protein EgtB [Methylicorpusculum sp.]
MSPPLKSHPAIPTNSRQKLIADYQRVRNISLEICAPLMVDDYQIQSGVETSPPKWHLAHVTWFFETFLLEAFDPGYQTVNPEYGYLFNSYYQTVGAMHARAKRGLLSRPTVEQVLDYRSEIDNRILDFLDDCDESLWQQAAFRLTLGLHHEQQHQELLFMDIKHNFWNNPLKPRYLQRSQPAIEETGKLDWEQRPGGLITIGTDGIDGFTFDNETPRHQVWLEPHRLSSRLITNSEFLDFMQDGGYMRPELWLSDGWSHIRNNQWIAPLYWENHDDQWLEFTLYGLETLDPSAPVAHISYYEADAYARWAGKRLPSEAELETKMLETPVTGHFSESGVFHPQAGEGQFYGSLWEWTASPYLAYPRFKPLEGSMGEYNGKFMCNQWVLRGGSCVTPENHIRPTYRNFFYPQDRWQFSGIRLADHL